VILRRLEGENVALAVDWQYHKTQGDSNGIYDLEGAKENGSRRER
jgi:hypothetical protein